MVPPLVLEYVAMSVVFDRVTSVDEVTEFLRQSLRDDVILAVFRSGVDELASFTVDGEFDRLLEQDGSEFDCGFSSHDILLC